MFVAGTINHLLRQNPWAIERLRHFAGRTVELGLNPVKACFVIEENGEFSPAVPDTIADAGITLTPLAALNLMARREVGASQIHLDGDTELAIEVAKVLQLLQWEYEEDLSRLIGDVPAHEMVRYGKQALAEGRRQAQNLARMFAEYWLEERPLIARKRDLERFTMEVGKLRDDAERLAKNMEKLEKSF